MKPPTLRTARLTLRPPALADFEPYAAMWSDARVTSYIGGSPRPRDLSWLKFTQMAGLWPLLGYGYWVVEAGPGFSGVAGLANFERGIAALAGVPEAGWAFTADSWGRGYASEAVATICGWADRALRQELRCMIDDANAASIRVAAKNGFVVLPATGEAYRIYARAAPVGGASDPSLPRE